MIVLVAVALYPVTVVVGKLRTALSKEETSPEIRSIDADETESPSD